MELGVELELDNIPDWLFGQVTDINSKPHWF